MAQPKDLSNRKMGFDGTMEIQKLEERRVGVSGLKLISLV
jgi:hypothetical protein